MMRSLYGNYRYRKFAQIWGTVEEFIKDCTESGIKIEMDEENLSLLYYLLYARYGNSTIASSDENQFKYRVFMICFMYGPTWEKKLQMQKEIRELTLTDLRAGSLAIYNHSLNPSTDPSTTSLEQLLTIDQQNTTQYKKSIPEAYANLNALLETDVTSYILDRFKSLFLKVVQPECPLWYVTPINDIEIIDDEEDE